MTSKTVQEAVDKLCLPAVVPWSWSFWKAPTTQKTKKHAELNDTAAEKLAFVFRQLAALTAWSHHQNQFRAVQKLAQEW